MIDAVKNELPTMLIIYENRPTVFRINVEYSKNHAINRLLCSEIDDEQVFEATKKFARIMSSANPCFNMCCNSLVNMIYMVGILTGGILTVIALATPAWRQAKGEQDFTNLGQVDYWSIGQRSYGIVAGSCNSNGSCLNYFKEQPDWKKGVLAAMILATLCCVAGFVWSFLACFACCCTSFLVTPLPVCAGLACALDVIGVVVYSVKSGQSDVGSSPLTQQNWEARSDVGYSFWIGIAAIVILLIDVFIGVFAVKAAKIMPA
uniref:Uncharacterized protein n=1 Tax=Romanomermis culicivorax TaxID=13658 RepID=A0A915JMX0_ROMCU